jgi:hypothetical protein
MSASYIGQKSRCKLAQSAKLSWSLQEKTRFIGRSWKDCKRWKSISDYVENLRLGDYGITGGHGRDWIWHMTLLEQFFCMKEEVFRTNVTCLLST